jgi:hypothetical protein
MDGWFRAYDAKTGKIVWEYSTTAQTYDTVNGVNGQPGGSIDGMGPTIAHCRGHGVHDVGLQRRSARRQQRGQCAVGVRVAGQIAPNE